MNCEVDRFIPSSQIQPNTSEVIEQSFKVQTDNDPKQTAKAPQKFIKEKK